jgi:hypothetical protein
VRVSDNPVDERSPQRIDRESARYLEWLTCCDVRIDFGFGHVSEVNFRVSDDPNTTVHRSAAMIDEPVA